MWKNWVLDATMFSDGPFCFCPLEGELDGDYSVITGFNYLGIAPPDNGKLVAVVHEAGQEAVDKFYEEHKEAIDEMFSKQSHAPLKSAKGE